MRASSQRSPGPVATLGTHLARVQEGAELEGVVGPEALDPGVAVAVVLLAAALPLLAVEEVVLGVVPDLLVRAAVALASLQLVHGVGERRATACR